MLREFRVNGADAPAADFSAAVELKTGMAVVKDYANKLLKLPEAATADNLFVVTKAPIPTGLAASLSEFSDYYEDFHAIAAGEKAVAYSYRADSAFGTDQYDEATCVASAAGGYAQAGTDGKWAVTSSATRYIFTGLYDDCGHTLARIEVIE